MRFTLTRFTLFLFIFTFIAVPEAEAHEPNHSYLYLRIYKAGIGGRFEMTAKDMNKALGLSLNEELDLEELKPHLPRIQEYLKSRSGFSSKLGNYGVTFSETTILPLEETEDFARINFDLTGVNEVPDLLDIEYSVLFEKAPTHRGVLVVEYNWKAGIVDNEALISNVFGEGKTKESLDLTDASLWKGFVALVKLGIWHIWIGLDHILFIVALILPSVVRRRKELSDSQLATADDGNTWVPVSSFKNAFLYILKIVTFFTIAHSITLALASLNIINLSSRFVESTIAISIALAALHNIIPIFKQKEWIIAFGFGLFHGFGFASVLGEKGLSGDYMVLSLLGFNLGVEIGQVLIICMVFPVLFLIRKLWIYPLLIKWGSAVLIFISIYWFIERGFEVDLPLGAWFWQIWNGLTGG